MATKSKTKSKTGTGNRRKPAGAAPVVAPLIAVTPQGLKQLEKNAHKASDLLGAMANTSRLMILCRLADGERSVSDLQPLIGLSQSALSQHLAVLRRRHLVRTRRDGQSIYYSLSSGEAASIIQTLHEQFCRRR
jgi:ArsR family transcriptional regulator, virulence genes transcriptional regulator